MKNRLPCHPVGLAGWLLCCSILHNTASSSDTWLLAPRELADQAQRVQVLLEVRGELRVPADAGAVRTLPLEVDARLQYWERWLQDSGESWPRRSLRLYEEAAANIRAGKGVVNQSLAPEHRLIAAQAQPGSALLYCPGSPLRREELDLIDVPGNSLLVHQVLPQRAVRIGDSWEVDTSSLAPLFGLEVATQSNVSGRLSSVEDQVAIIELAGRIDGAVGGIASEIELQAKGNFDLQQGRLTWFAVSLREKRAIGHAEPGFEVTARLRMLLQPESPPAALLAAQRPADAAEPAAAVTLLSYQAERAGYRLIHDRRWRAMTERPGLTVLRLVDRGDLVAQCNISELPDVEAGQQLSLETFQTDIQKSLQGLFGQFLEAAQTSGDDGRRVLRVTVSGRASEIPVQWIYYHISEDSGRRAAMAFTLEAELVERFAEADRGLAASFEFTPRSAPQEARREDQPGARR